VTSMQQHLWPRPVNQLRRQAPTSRTMVLLGGFSRGSPQSKLRCRRSLCEKYPHGSVVSAAVEAGNEAFPFRTGWANWRRAVATSVCRQQLGPSPQWAGRGVAPPPGSFTAVISAAASSVELLVVPTPRPLTEEVYDAPGMISAPDRVEHPVSV